MRRFCVWTSLGVTTILVMAILFPRTSPWRWSYWDLGYIVPVIGCTTVAVLLKMGVGFRSRAISGFCQSLAFLAVFAQGRVSLRDPVEVTTKWVTWVVAYTLVFTAVTHGIVLVSRRGKGNEEHCEKCGYSLYGLRTPRCPECGTPFDPSRIKEQAPPAAGGTITS